MAITGDPQHSVCTGPAALAVWVLRTGGEMEAVDDVPAALAARAPGDLVWVDLDRPDVRTLEQVTDLLAPGTDLHPLVREDVVDVHRRAKVDRFDDHLFLDLIDLSVRTAEAATPGPWAAHRVELDGGEVVEVGTVSALVYAEHVVTVRTRSEVLAAERVRGLWAAGPRARREGPGLLLHALLDEVVDHVVGVTEILDADTDELEEAVTRAGRSRSGIQSRAFTLRKATSLVRRVAMPTREVVGQILRRDAGSFLAAALDGETLPYLHDVADHVVRVSETLDALRDELTSVLELNMAMQDAELNEVMKKLSAWAAIIAVPTAVTGYFGQNVPYPGFSAVSGFVQSTVFILVGALGLALWFRRLRWL